jgi:hypothetical protein
MAKRIFWLAGIAAVIIIMVASSMAQSCATWFQINNIQLDRDGLDTFTLELNFGNLGPNCRVGAIQFDIETEPFDVIRPIDFDATGGRISGWEQINTVQVTPQILRVWAVANDFPPPYTPPIDTGFGLLGTLTFEWGCTFLENIDVIVRTTNIFVYDSTGQNQLDEGPAQSTVHVGEDSTHYWHDIPRGDANCTGNLLGADVTYLINFFRGFVDCPCCLCAGDANNNDAISGSDVTFLVNYFRGGPAPVPCD